MLCLARTAISADKIITLAFRNAIAIINPTTIAIFSHETYKVIFEHLLAVSAQGDGLFGPVSNHFEIVKTNKRDMLHFYYLFWLQRMTSLLIFIKGSVKKRTLFHDFSLSLIILLKLRLLILLTP